MKLIIISDREPKKKVEIEIIEDSGIHDIMDEIYGLLIAFGYHPDSVKAGFLSKAEEFEDDNN